MYGMANALNAAMGDDDVPWDAETEFKRYLYNALGNKTLVNGILYGVGGWVIPVFRLTNCGSEIRLATLTANKYGAFTLGR